MFPESLPGFNLRGKSQTSSTVGGAFSVLILMLTLMYGTNKMIQLLSRKNPTISTFTEPNALDSSEVLDLYESNIHFAFGVQKFSDETFADDARYVKSVVRLYGKKDGVAYDRMLDFHVCTEEEYAQFAPPDAGSESLMKMFRTDPKNSLYCIDREKEKDNLKIWGQNKDANY